MGTFWMFVAYWREESEWDRLGKGTMCAVCCCDWEEGMLSRGRALVGGSEEGGGECFDEERDSKSSDIYVLDWRTSIQSWKKQTLFIPLHFRLRACSLQSKRGLQAFLHLLVGMHPEAVLANADRIQTRYARSSSLSIPD